MSVSLPKPGMGISAGSAPWLQVLLKHNKYIPYRLFPPPSRCGFRTKSSGEVIACSKTARVSSDDMSSRLQSPAKHSRTSDAMFASRENFSTLPALQCPSKSCRFNDGLDIATGPKRPQGSSDSHALPLHAEALQNVLYAVEMGNTSGYLL